MTGISTERMVSVVMPLFNGAAYLQAAIDSIVGQTWKNWELIIIDDSSTDGSDEIASGQTDPRIRVIRNSGRRGVASALNCGFDVVRGDYVARMDADDLCRPERLARQVAFLEIHPAVSVCGTWVQCIGSGHDLWRYPLDDAAAKTRLLFDTPFAHPTVMMRRQLVSDGWRYNEHCGYVEDYEMWLRGRRRLTYANLAEPLLDYRIHPHQVGARLKTQQQLAARALRKELFTDLCLDPQSKELDLHDLVTAGARIPDHETLLAVEAWLHRLDEANRAAGLFDPAALGGLLAERWWQSCHLACHLGPRVWSSYSRSPLRLRGRISWQDEWKFLLRCRLRSLPGSRARN